MSVFEARNLNQQVQKGSSIRLLMRSGRVAQGEFVASDAESVTVRDDEGLARIPANWVVDWQALEAPIAVAPPIPKPDAPSDSRFSDEVVAKTAEIVGRLKSEFAHAHLRALPPAFSVMSKDVLPSLLWSLQNDIGRLKDHWEYAHKIHELSRLQSLRLPLQHQVDQYPTEAAFPSILGSIALELDDYPAALEAFGRAVRVGAEPNTFLNLAVAAGYQHRGLMLHALQRYFTAYSPSVHSTAWTVLVGISLELAHTSPLVQLLKRWSKDADSRSILLETLVLLLYELRSVDAARHIVSTLIGRPPRQADATVLNVAIGNVPVQVSRAVIDEVAAFWGADVIVPVPRVAAQRVPAPLAHEQPRSFPDTPPEHPKLLAGRRAFDRGDLVSAKALFAEVYASGDRSLLLFLNYVQTLQRLQEFSAALLLLDDALTVHTVAADRAKLITAQAHIHSARADWKQAAAAYQALLEVPPRPAARRHITLQLASMYQHAGDDRARMVLTDFLSKNPTDEVARRQLVALDAPEIDDPPEDDDLSEFSVDVPDEPEGRISPLLRRDLETADFRDEGVLAKGGRPDQFDAKRLLDIALSVKQAKFPERYPLFLEAAKAFSQLPDGSYNLEDFLEALARYSALKAGAFASELQRRLTSAGGKDDLHEFNLLRDTAMSYYLEALVFQATVRPAFILVPLTNYLRVQVSCALRRSNEPLPDNFFGWTFAHLLTFCSEGHGRVSRGPSDYLARELTVIAFDTLISCAAAGGRTWRAISRLNRGEVRHFLARVFDDPERRSEIYRLLSELSGTVFPDDQRPGDVLRQASRERARRALETIKFCQSLGRISPTSHNFRELSMRWSQFPNYRGTLLDTDQEIMGGIENLLGTLAPYAARQSQEEKTGILFSSRTIIEGLLRFIDAHPTRWGREAFEPLLTRWQLGIRQIEQRRASEIQPTLRARLEPEIFSADDGQVQGGLMIENTGLGTADGVSIRVTVREYASGTEIWSTQARLKEEVSARAPGRELGGGAVHFPFQFALTTLTEGLRAPYRMDVELTPHFRQMEIDSVAQTFTIQVGSPATFRKEDIPWEPMGLPAEHLFKGRDELLDRIASELRSPDRMRAHILYGLTRTGKTTLLKYLGKRLDLTATGRDPEERFISIDWHFDKAANLGSHEAVASYLLRDLIRIKLLSIDGPIRALASHELFAKEVTFADWHPILTLFRDAHLYPVFLIDEFTFYRSLVDKHFLDASFLATMRHHALDGLSSFICAGTYDVRTLMRDPAYGVTGQFVNAFEVQVNRIAREPCLELTDVMEPELRFTEDAKDHILDLSYRVPYFVQLICKHAAEYAFETKRRVLGFPEIERVAQALSGELGQPAGTVRVSATLNPTAFAPMLNPSDPPTFQALFTTICSLQSSATVARFVTYDEILNAWRAHGLTGFEGALSRAIEELVAREVLTESTEDELPSYRLGPDLFRRWWRVQHRHLAPSLDQLERVL